MLEQEKTDKKQQCMKHLKEFEKDGKARGCCGPASWDQLGER